MLAASAAAKAEANIHSLTSHPSPLPLPTMHQQHGHSHGHTHQPVHGHSHSHGHSHAVHAEPAPPPPYPAQPSNDSASTNPAAEHPLEGAHQATVQACWDSYLRTALSANQRRRADFFSLPVRQRELLGDYSALLSQVSALRTAAEAVSARDGSRQADTIGVCRPTRSFRSTPALSRLRSIRVRSRRPRMPR